MSGLIDWSEQPKVRLHIDCNAQEIRDLWIAVGQLNYYLSEDPEQDIMPFDHPLVRMTLIIQGRLDELIANGMKGGVIVAPLLEIKQRIADAEEHGELQE